MPTRTVKISERLYQRAAQHADKLGISICDSLDRLASGGEQAADVHFSEALLSQLKEMEVELELQRKIFSHQLHSALSGIVAGQGVLAEKLQIDPQKLYSTVNAMIQSEESEL